ncbi:SWIM zinc finger family protein [Myxacorys almedinensis]|uniref:Metal-binding protein n=1 Tax=Myxacorys almedinensis A TaxID=2690445 RepID=A0A8J7YYN1_9CYAN|nr:SWIM zinc finger family protein [Myxacorys almedinensis]NDJ16479.1 metal-binding protein [Myxacorys almedinensis A]
MSDSYSQPSREWWAQRWIDVLESFGWIRRLARARTYAREGNVLSLEFDGAKVHAEVQGTAPEPYQVSLSLDPFSDEQWSYIVESMAERAIFSAKLLAGEMPQNIEDVFTANGLSLFPFNKFDIHSRCSCPDPANPCKHIGAVYYLLGDRFSEDPFVLFQLRGRTKEQIIADLRQIRGTGDTISMTGDTEGIAPSETVEDLASAQPPRPTPLNCDPRDFAEQDPLESGRATRFWDYQEQLEPSLIVITPPPTSETILDVLGSIPFKSDASENQAVMEYLRTIYQAASMQAVQTAMSTEI